MQTRLRPRHAHSSGFPFGARPVRRCEPAPDAAPGAPGTLRMDGTLCCGSGAVRLLEVQAAGGRVIPFGAWSRGARLEGEPMVTSAPPAREP